MTEDIQPDLNAKELWRGHGDTGEPLTEDEVQVVVEAGITSWDEWDDRGGGLYWHAPTWPALED